MLLICKNCASENWRVVGHRSKDQAFYTTHLVCMDCEHVLEMGARRELHGEGDKHYAPPPVGDILRLRAYDKGNITELMLAR